MPQDTTIQYINSEGHVVPFDSLPAEEQQQFKEALKLVEGKVDRVIIDTTPETHGESGLLVFFVFFIITVLLIITWRRSIQEQAPLPDSSVWNNDEEATEEAPPNNYLVYPGNSLNFSDVDLEYVLNKHFVFYTRLTEGDKLKFIYRLKKFMGKKIFVIHDESGFREMPILIAASAVQIGFGLDKYLLPYFSHIHIFPEEFVGTYPTLRLLEGNVTGHTINLSWKHFLNGYQYPENGQNVGLHEFAHAFYYQYFDAREQVEEDFVAAYPLFNQYGTTALQQEKLPGNDLYSDYALTNFDEFWAESVELFFEKPSALNTKYPDLYHAICEMLNQDPLTYLPGFA